MPIMDGYRATTLIRQDSKWQSIPIVALSALNLDQEIAKMERVGMDAFLPKPLNLKQLSTIFKTYLGGLYKDELHDLEEIKFECNLKGLDIQKALSGVGGDLDILKDMLFQFRNDYQYSDRRIEFYIKVEDYKMLQKILVDLIGLSGSIGATKLFELSKQMYKDFIFSRFEDIAFKIPELNRELDLVCSSIDTFLERVS
jgi:CheY-like chemotaxis protein